MSIRLGLPVSSDTLEKAGFERGPKAGHKYWKRVRVVRRGKAEWKYYYNTPQDRKRWIEEQGARAETGFAYFDIRCHPYSVPE